MVDITSELTIVSLADSTTGWAGSSGQLDVEVFKQGTGAYTYQTGKNGIGDGSFTHAINLDWTSTAGRQLHLYWTMKCDVFPFCELLNTGSTNSGLMVKITDGSGNYIQWHIAGRDTWDGGWRNFVLNIEDASKIHSSSGTLDYTDIDVIDWYTDNSNSGNIRIIDNTWLDSVRIGYGLNVKSTGTANFNFTDIANVDELTANYYSTIQQTDGILFCAGGIQIGGGITNFVSENEVVVFKSGIIGYDHYKISNISPEYANQRGSILQASDITNGDTFGNAVSLSDDGTELVVGAQFQETTGIDTGAVYTYDRSGSTWVQRGSILQLGTLVDLDQFGSAVSLSGDGTVLVVGASYKNASNADGGLVYTYDRSGNIWVQRGLQLELFSGANASDRFGTSVSLSDDGTVLVVGCDRYEQTVAGSNHGTVLTYDRSGSTWIQRGSKIIPSNTSGEDRFGTSVSLSGDGTALVVGAIGVGSTTFGKGDGALYTYDRSGSTWVQRGSILTEPNKNSGNFFGCSVSLSGDGTELVVGSKFNNTKGIVYRYKRSNSIWDIEGFELQSSDIAVNDNFGSAVSLSDDGTELVVGAETHETTGTDTGAVYTYDYTASTNTIELNGFIFKSVVVADGSVTDGVNPSYFDMSDVNVTFSMDGSTFTNIGDIKMSTGTSNDNLFINCGYTELGDAHTSTSCLWDGSRLVDLLAIGATIDTCTFDNLDNTVNDSYVTTTKLDDITDCIFNQKTANYAVELTSLGTGTMQWDNTLSGYTATDGLTSSAIHVTPTSGTLTINVGTGYSTPSINSDGATVTVVSGQVPVNITVIDAVSKSVIQDARVYIIANETTADYTLGDELFNDVTDVNGKITFNITLSEPLLIGRRVRKSSTTPLYKTTKISATINNTIGLDLTVQMTPDE